MLAWLTTKLKRAESSRANNEPSRASYRATSILSSPNGRSSREGCSNIESDREGRGSDGSNEGDEGVAGRAVQPGLAGGVDGSGERSAKGEAGCRREKGSGLLAGRRQIRWPAALGGATAAD
jgi:hypothetical protein